MRRSSCVALLLVFGLSTGLPAFAEDKTDTRAITQRISELRSRLDSLRGISPSGTASKPGTVFSQNNKAKNQVSGQADSPTSPMPTQIDGEKFVLLPPADAPDSKSSASTPEVESNALEHRQDVTVTVLFHDEAAPTSTSGKPTSSSPSPTKSAPNR